MNETTFSKTRTACALAASALIAALLLCLSCLAGAQRAWAADPSVNVNLSESKNVISVSLSDLVDIDEEVRAIQLTLNFDAIEGSMDGITPGFNFSSEVKAPVKQVRYNGGTHNLTLYIAGATSNLLAPDKTLNLGSVSIEAVSTASADIVVTYLDDSLKLVGTVRNQLMVDAEPQQEDGLEIKVPSPDYPESVNGGGSSGSSGNGSSSGSEADGVLEGGTIIGEGVIDGTGEGSEGTGASDGTDGANANDPANIANTNVSPNVAKMNREAAEGSDTNANNSAGIDVIPLAIGIVVTGLVLGCLLWFLLGRKKPHDEEEDATADEGSNESDGAGNDANGSAQD